MPIYDFKVSERSRGVEDTYALELRDAAAARREARAGAADLAFEMASRGVAEVMTVEVSDVAGAMVYAARLQFDEAASAD